MSFHKRCHVARLTLLHLGLATSIKPIMGISRMVQLGSNVMYVEFQAQHPISLSHTIFKTKINRMWKRKMFKPRQIPQHMIVTEWCVRNAEQKEESEGSQIDMTYWVHLCAIMRRHTLQVRAVTHNKGIPENESSYKRQVQKATTTEAHWRLKPMRCSMLIFIYVRPKNNGLEQQVQCWKTLTN